ncbi:unnamed protein product [Ranitomeya imitator]|uniref:Uncharacterized protein n=1 Tax=Ranitomeya imitator TaxID=111125 RepID=A0ABN9LDR6_9NEOB|nr:unnamed protein product [Ranitomeya imitator]
MREGPAMTSRSCDRDVITPWDRKLATELQGALGSEGSGSYTGQQTPNPLIPTAVPVPSQPPVPGNQHPSMPFPVPFNLGSDLVDSFPHNHSTNPYSVHHSMHGIFPPAACLVGGPPPLTHNPTVTMSPAPFNLPSFLNSAASHSPAIVAAMQGGSAITSSPVPDPVTPLPPESLGNTVAPAQQ